MKEFSTQRKHPIQSVDAGGFVVCKDHCLHERSEVGNGKRRSRASSLRPCRGSNLDLILKVMGACFGGWQSPMYPLLGRYSSK